jgi:hypothetical protein
VTHRAGNHAAAPVQHDEKSLAAVLRKRRFFFLERKKQRIFMIAWARPVTGKSFLVLFFKKERRSFVARCFRCFSDGGSSRPRELAAGIGRTLVFHVAGVVPVLFTPC